MLHLTGKPGEPSPKIQLSPRTGFKKWPILEKELIYGHACPYCFNVIQALFITDKPVDLFPYEETAVMSKSQDSKKIGTVAKFVPEYEDVWGHTNYTSTILQGGGVTAQHLALKNHILKFEGIDKPVAENGANYFEPGEKCCEYTGIFSVRKDLMVKDILLFMQMTKEAMDKFHIPTLDHFLMKCGNKFRTLQAYGDAPPVVLVRRENMQFGMASTLTEIMKDITAQHQLSQAVAETVDQ